MFYEEIKIKQGLSNISLYSAGWLSYGVDPDLMPLSAASGSALFTQIGLSEYLG